MKKVVILFTIIILIFLVLGLALNGLYSSLPVNQTGKYYVVIYGNTVYSNGTPSSRLKARLDAGKKLYDQGVTLKIIVSGGIDKSGNDEGVVMKNYLIKQGAKSNDIIIDSAGNTTRDSSENSYDIISKLEKNVSEVGVIGVSQYFHIPRVKLSLLQAGFKNVYGYTPKYFEWRDIYSITREIFAYIKYLVTK